MHISKILAEAEASSEPSFSLEFFPPKTTQGIDNLYSRWETTIIPMAPKFIDVTWGAGGTLSGLTLEMVSVAQNLYGLNTLMYVIQVLMRNSLTTT